MNGQKRDNERVEKNFWKLKECRERKKGTKVFREFKKRFEYKKREK